MRQFLLQVILLLSVPRIYAQMAETIYTVIAPSGLSLREAPSLDAERLAVVPFNTQVAQDGEIDHSQEDTIDGFTGYWMPVRYEGYRGYLFTPYLKYGDLFRAPSSESAFTILMPGERIEAVHFDSSLYWYALPRPKPDANPASYSLQAVQPEIHFGPEYNREYMLEYGISSDLVTVDCNLTDHPLLLIGCTQPLKNPEHLPTQYYWEEATPYDDRGKILYPYQTIGFFDPPYNGTPYYLYAEEEVLNCPGSACKSYTLSVTRYPDCYYEYCSSIQQLSSLLDPAPADWPEEEAYPRHFRNHPRLLWQADLNADGAPELLFFQPTHAECCGGSEGYILLQSVQTLEGYRWERASADVVEFWGGC